MIANHQRGVSKNDQFYSRASFQPLAHIMLTSFWHHFGIILIRYHPPFSNGAPSPNFDINFLSFWRHLDGASSNGDLSFRTFDIILRSSWYHFYIIPGAPSPNPLIEMIPSIALSKWYQNDVELILASGWKEAREQKLIIFLIPPWHIRVDGDMRVDGIFE